jgi:hypothetical protein
MLTKDKMICFVYLYSLELIHKDIFNIKCIVFFFQTETQTTKNDVAIVEQGLSSRNNFPKGLRGGGPCFDW